jgi:hypothetical protein
MLLAMASGRQGNADLLQDRQSALIQGIIPGVKKNPFPRRLTSSLPELRGEHHRMSHIKLGMAGNERTVSSFSLVLPPSRQSSSVAVKSFGNQCAVNAHAKHQLRIARRFGFKDELP